MLILAIELGSPCPRISNLKFLTCPLGNGTSWTSQSCITKTCLYNFDPLIPHLYIVELGFTWVYIIFLISAQKHRLWVLVEAVLMSTHNLCFEQQYEKYQKFLSEKFQFFGGKIFSIFDFHNGVHVFQLPCCYNILSNQILTKITSKYN